MLNIGCHLSSSKGFTAMAKSVLNINADTFQFFTRNPQGGKAKDIDVKDVAEFNNIAKQHNFAKFVAHAPYTLNPCSDNPATREFAEMVFVDDLRRMEFVPNNYYNFHPGSHVGQGIEKGIAMISDLLNKILQPSQSTMVLLETMSGKGSEVGSSFAELQQIMSRVELSDKLGVCLDTCHVYSAGYEKAVHLNDSKMPFASHKDRHEKIGYGTIGKEAIIRFINHEALKNIPFILETPNDLSGWADEIKMLQDAYKG